jgi:hypothetical protein
LLSSYSVPQKEPASPYVPQNTGPSSNNDSSFNSSSNVNNNNSYSPKKTAESDFKSSGNTSNTFAFHNATQDTNQTTASSKSGNNNNTDSTTNNTSSKNNRYSTDTGKTNTNASINEESYTSPSFSSSPSHLNPVQYVAVMAENEELKSELEVLSKQLESAKIQKEEQDKEVC